MSENFDIGPLTWVQDEINQSLDSVLENLSVLQRNQHDTAVLKFSQTYLYQISGALDMVGLEGCKRFCNELEKLAKKIEQQEINVSSELIEAFVKAVKTLQYYIQALLNGAPDIPLRLYPVLNPLVTAQGETLDESELFFPDTSQQAPKDVPSKELSDEEYAHFIVQQRLNYQKSLLSWLQTKQYSAVESMREAVSNVSYAQHKPSAKTLWWAASAFTETLESGAIADHPAAKKLCRRLDQELRQLAGGVSKPHNHLLRDILYFVAISEIDKETVRKVKEVFSLDQVVDKAATNDTSVFDPPAEELALVAQLVNEIEALRAIWSEISDSINRQHKTAVAAQDLVDLDNVLMTRFVDKLSASQPLSQPLSHQAIHHLLQTLLQTCEVLQADKSKVTHSALVEVASTIHLLEQALTQYQQANNQQQALQTQAKRLEAISAGVIYEATEAEQSSEVDRETLTALVKDIHASLKQVEQALDVFFRNSAEKSSLILAPKPLTQISAIFDILVMPTPKAIVDACAQFVAYFSEDTYQENQQDFELVAESLSMVGLYAEELPKTRPESEQAMAACLQRLEAATASLHVPPVTPAAEISQLKTTILENTSQKAPPVMDDSESVIDQAIDAELLDIYLTEAEEVLAHIAQNTQALRINATNHEALVEVRRSFHTLKGSGRTVGLSVLGDLAGAIETFLNQILEKSLQLDSVQLDGLDTLAGAFAAWLTELKTHQQVSVNPVYWQNKIKQLSTSVGDSAEVVSPEDAFVLIGGTLKISRAFYDIFMQESMQHITKLEQDVAKITEHQADLPSPSAKQAVHTLASNALAVGFNSLGTLGRALERFLDEVNHDWGVQQLELYSSAVKSIADMWQKISELKIPRAAKSLTKLLTDATEAFKSQSPAADQAPAMSLAEQEMLAEMADDAALTSVAADAQKVTQDTPSMVAPATTENNQEEHADVDQALLSLFIDEAQDIIPEMGEALRAWHANPQQKNHSEVLQRALHTFKGSARMARQMVLGDIAHALEEQVVDALKHGPKDRDFDSMFVDLDKIGSLFERTVQPASDEALIPTDADEKSVSVRTVDRKQYLRLSAEALNRLINEAGEISIIRSRMDREMVDFKQSSHDLSDSLTRLRNYLRELEIEAELQMQSRMNVLQEAHESFDPLEFDRFTRLQELTRMIAESVNDVGTIQGGLLANLDHTEAALQQQNRMNRDLQQNLLSVRMLPFKQITDRLQRIVRQTARELNKTVQLIITGESVEMDRSVLDKLGAPLEHLLRNAIAHGIELPALRESQAKSGLGTIRLTVRQQNDEIHLTVADDGAGVDLAKVKTRAAQQKLLQEKSDISEQALLAVIFEPGFSTADSVSQIAGRGVGLDVVRSEISALGGRVELTSERQKGSTFSIHLPVTQSVAQVLIVRSGLDTYALPVSLIEQAQKMKPQALTAAYVSGEIEWAGHKYPLHHLAKLLDHQEHQLEDSHYASILLLRSGAYHLALHVDDVLGNQEVVVKSIGAQLSRIPGIVGATVTGEGRIILIVNPVQIANRELLSAGKVSVKTVKRKPAKQIQKTKALVVDDSLTMRKVLGRLLEREGYEVLVAKDGMDAMQVLQEVTPDIILTDIEMPRMDGFGLSRNIRDDARTAKTPLIMISSRTADKHQSLAQEIGVDAFFGKPVHDEALIEKIKALLSVNR